MNKKTSRYVGVVLGGFFVLAGAGLYTAQYQIKELDQKVHTLKVDLKQSYDEKEELEVILEGAKKEIESTKKEVEDTKKRLSEEKETRSKLEKQNKKKDSKIEKLEKDLSAKKQREEQEKMVAQQKKEQEEAKQETKVPTKAVAVSRGANTQEKVKEKAKRKTEDDTDKAVKSTQPKKEVKTATNEKGIGVKMQMNTSYYGMDCNGCTGRTASGYNLKKGQTSVGGYKVVAADTNILPLHTKIKVTNPDGSSYKAVVLDRGGAIKGQKLDVLVGSEAESKTYGRHSTTVEVISYGDNSYKKVN